MHTKALVLAWALTLGLSAGAAAAVTLEGDFVRVGVNTRGTLGSGGATPPGIQHDPTGTRNFGVNDYLTPGLPRASRSTAPRPG